MSDVLGMQSPRKKAKIVKDAPVFVRGPTRGEVRYPPFVYTAEDKNEEKDVGKGKGDGRHVELVEKLQDYHDQFEVYPRQEQVGEYPRFIPYNSERRIFADATGRDFFEGMLSTPHAHASTSTSTSACAFTSTSTPTPQPAPPHPNIYINEFDHSLMGVWMYNF